ncbi:alpha-mannosidase [Entomoplasma freundtii]|uniref:Glycosyl hydrolase n=1 Tax=Entomoplasma freundtii TaxID=74700 RepID=A0A2K8NSC6_9MOLU|nr:glycosyl hydrolase-related protein [Entomoplasma freundtii]ATZ16058.1 glycosyl hydrolase [Entomoplasma freundtii]TDY58073.1 alpha-mannosidase [Entomoplasma freundtii]
MNDSWKIYVVPHTHWDKEWYFTKQDSDVLLIQNIKAIKETFKKNQSYKNFTYDGQTSIIDDYREYYPEDFELDQLLVDKKIIIGPWYTQPDFFNTTSESIFRNLLYGIKLAETYSGHFLHTAYVPDSFGHNAQMPQIYKQFNLHNFLYWRGVRKGEIQKYGLYTKWEGIDGTTINAYNLLFGYWSAGSNFPYLALNEKNVDTQALTFLENMQVIVEDLKKNSPNTEKTLLLPLGGDQAPINEWTPQFLEAVNKLSTDEWILSDYDDFFQNLKVDETKLGTLKNELKSPALSRIHKTIGSQRADIKMLMKQVETNLYNVLEPLAICWWSLGGGYPQATIDKALKLILLSQAHDSAGGCNSDQTNADILVRLRQANDIVLSETTKCLKNFASALNLKEEQLLVFNPKPYRLEKDIQLKVFTPFKHFELFDNKNNRVHHVVLKQKSNSGGQQVVAIDATQGEATTGTATFYETDVLILKTSLSPMSFTILTPKEVAKKACRKKNHGFYCPQINEDGTIDLYDYKNAKIYRNQFKLYAQFDGGDSYDYSPVSNANLPIEKLIKTTTKNEIFDQVQHIIINNTYLVPKSFDNSELVEQLVKLELFLTDQPTIYCRIVVKNQVETIRWRIVAQNSQKQSSVFANQSYCTIERPTHLENDLAVWEEEKWTEKPVAIETMESFVYFQNATEKLGWITNGLNEYEVVNDQELHLTLYRSVPYLGRNNLLWRPGRASGTSEIVVPTNDAAFLQKELVFEAWWFADNQENSWELAENTILKVPFYQVQNFNKLAHRFDRFLLPKPNLNQILPKTFLEINNRDFIVKTLKLTWDHQQILVRGFNSSSKPITISMTWNNEPLSLTRSNGLEEIFETKSSFTIQPLEIVTVLLPINFRKVL